MITSRVAGVRKKSLSLDTFSRKNSQDLVTLSSSNSKGTGPSWGLWIFISCSVVQLAVCCSYSGHPRGQRFCPNPSFTSCARDAYENAYGVNCWTRCLLQSSPLWTVLGTILSLQTPYINSQKINTIDHCLLDFSVFFFHWFCYIYGIWRYCHVHFPPISTQFAFGEGLAANPFYSSGDIQRQLPRLLDSLSQISIHSSWSMIPESSLSWSSLLLDLQFVSISDHFLDFGTQNEPGTVD